MLNREPRNKPQTRDLFTIPSDNYNVCVLGTSGSGKSFLPNELSSRLLSSGGRLRIIDKGRSFEQLSKMSRSIRSSGLGK